MAMHIIEQTVTQKNISFSKLILMIFGGLFFVNVIARILGIFGSFAGRVGGIIAFLAAIVGCIFIMYKHIAYFNYRLIDDELIMEKVFGRASHLFLTVKLTDMDYFKQYGQVRPSELKRKKIRFYRFISGKNTDSWYIGKFTRDKKEHYFIIEPNEQLLEGIKFFTENK